MLLSRRATLSLGLSALTLAACGHHDRAPEPMEPGNTPEMRAKIKHWSRELDVPESLMHRVVKRESNYNPAARNGPYYGLMQILPQTARTMGYEGPDSGLLDADTNLHYGGRYLRGAWLVSHHNEDRAIKWYSQGYYYEAKRQGLLEETGLRG